MSTLTARLVATALLFGTGLASASEPSSACRDGATQCRDALAKLDECERAQADKPEGCTAVRGDADAACRSSTSACHTDGSRSPPATPPSNAPTALR